MGENSLGTPLTHSINQMFSDTDHLLMHSPSRGFEIDFSLLPHLDNIDEHSGLHFDFSTLLPVEPHMSSSPPGLRNLEMLAFGGSLEIEFEMQHPRLQSSPRSQGAVKQGTRNAKRYP
jgi:hypothetical protein